MTSATPVTRKPISGQPTAPRKFSIQDIKTTGPGLPNRYIFYALEKFGKTSFAAQAPKPIFIMTNGETGLLTLIDAGQIKQTPHFPECTNWEDLLAQVQALRDEETAYKTLVIDTMNGAEKMCHEYVCNRDYAGDWGERGFMGYQRGYETSLPEWRIFLNALDSLRVERKITIFMLSHTAVRNFKNPSGPDFDRFQPELHRSTWAITNKWVDCILFGAYDTTVKTIDKNKEGVPIKGKATGGQTRMIYAQRDAAFDAGSRIALPAEIEMGDSPTEAWKNFMDALKSGRTSTAEPQQVVA